MFLFRLSQLLLLLWKLSTVYIIPIIMFAYIYFMGQFLNNFSFSDLDTGANFHKWSVFIIYLLYLIFWKVSSKSVEKRLKKWEY